MKYIFLTQTFKKRLSKLKKHFTKKDLLYDLKDFMINGLRKDGTYLKKQTILEIEIETVKLRICIQSSHGRYLVAIINNEKFIPIFIDIKTGKYGDNLSLGINKKQDSIILNSFEKCIYDYLNHTEENPLLEIIGVKI